MKSSEKPVQKLSFSSSGFKIAGKTKKKSSQPKEPLSFSLE